MSTIIKGSFKTLEDNVIYVEIKSPNGLARYTIGENEIKFAEDPIEIKSNCEKLLDHIIKKQCTISLITSIWLGSLFTGNDRDVTVSIWKNDTLIFFGYARPQSFSQPWANNKERFEINCFDYLSTLANHYMTDHGSYVAIKKQNNVLSFKDYLSKILPTYTYYDNSKNVSGDNPFERCGVSMNVFLGKEQDDLMNDEEILEEILRYLNLHAIQLGQKILLFDWNMIGSPIIWTNIYNGSTTEIDTSTINVTQDMYADNDTNISMNEIYNRISVKDNFEKREDVINSPLDTKEIKYYSPYKQLWYSEIVSEGEGKSARNAFNSVVKQMYTNFNRKDLNEKVEWTDYDKWWREDWYMKWAYNPNWKLYYQGQPISDWLEYNENGKVIRQHRIMTALKANRFMPAMVSVGANKNRINYTRPSRLSDGNIVGEIQMTDYLVISVNGNLDDSEAEFERIDTALKSACGANGNNIKDAHGLFVYTGESGTFTPPDDDTTNYIVFSGSIILNPVYLQSGIAVNNEDYMTVYENKPDVTFQRMWEMAQDDEKWHKTVNISQNGDGALYSQQFYSCADPSTQLEHLEKDMLMLYPYVKEDKRQEIEYNYSAHWDNTDKINKLEILVCQMQVGDKYLVETSNGDRQKPSYSWMTEAQASQKGYDPIFTIGIDPEIGDYIIGKEYEICNTVNGRYSDEKGLAVPIKRSDNLSGAVTFKILSVCNSEYNEITRRHPTMFRHTKYYDNWKNLLSHISAIWIKDFDIKIISDNGGAEIANENKDIIWYSNVNHSSIEAAEDVEFKLTTQPTTAVLLEHGIPTNVSNTNVVDMTTNISIQEITDVASNQTAMPEWLYIDHYYRWYSVPRAIIETTLFNGNIQWPEMRGFNFANDFGTTTPMEIEYNLKNDTFTVKAIQNT